MVTISTNEHDSSQDPEQETYSIQDSSVLKAQGEVNCVMTAVAL